MMRPYMRIASFRHGSHKALAAATARSSFRRFQSSEPTRDPSSAPLANENVFASSLAFALNVWRRFFTFGALGLVVSGALVGASLEGAHLWVEYKELAPETDGECKKWEWDLDMERWTGGNTGGTDAGLGFKGYHALRAAWQVQNWGVGASSDPSTSSSSSGFSSIEPRLQAAHDFLAVAYKIAQDRAAAGRVRSETPAELLIRLADVMERIGTRDALFEARSELEEVWTHVAGNAHDASRLALKLGDINHRMGTADLALVWWARALDIVSGGSRDAPPRAPTVPSSLPSSPSAQRTLASTLVALSAFYATSSQLRQAQQVETAALNLLRSIPTPPSFASATPPQALHALFLLHRSALLSVHLAEVSHGLRSPAAASIEWLTRAAESSERVARVLTGVQRQPGAKDDPAPPTSRPLLSVFDGSLSMKRPARSLLRDARRTAAESWHLMGLLHEHNRAAGAREMALACYERALAWAGVSQDRAAGEEGGLEAEWKALWGNYVRVRDLGSAKSAGT